MPEGSALAPLLGAPLGGSLVPDTVPADLAPALKFPSAWALQLVADAFPRPTADRQAARREVGWLAVPEADGHLEVEHWTHREGSWPQLEFGPGMLRVARVDHAAAERAAERRSRAARREVDLDTLDGGGGAGSAGAPGLRGDVSAWSRKSQVRLMRTIASLDLEPMVTGAVAPVMVTLTCPPDWLMFTPDGAEASKRFRRWVGMWARKWGEAPSFIWKREFQRRGAPHWHLWLTPPVADLARFRRWVRSSWSRVLFSERVVSGPFRPAEFRKHVRYGANVDRAAAMRARDPKLLAHYFLKESGAGLSKQYQNEPPPEWAGAPVGRYWGVRGLQSAVQVVPLDPSDAYAVWRVLRGIRQSHMRPKERGVPRGVYRVSGWYEPSTGRSVPPGTPGAVFRGAGEVRYRRVKRRQRVPGIAGWAAVNDGASEADRLARFVASRAATRASRSTGTEVRRR